MLLYLTASKGKSFLNELPPTPIWFRINYENKSVFFTIIGFITEVIAVYSAGTILNLIKRSLLHLPRLAVKAIHAKLYFN
jgi:hypothetical protein